MSLYAVLGVRPEDDAAAVRAAYDAALRAAPRSWRGRLLAWLCGRSPAVLAHACKVLSDPARRAAYDRQLQLNLWLAQAPPGH